jgi:class 3 adenylate cyclase
LEAERRQLTVLFCDLEGSTALAQKLDPEQLRDLMQAYQRACKDVIVRYEGHVAQYLGNGLMAYFGWPEAHENDAVRAIRAGLEVTHAVAQLIPTVGIRARGNTYRPRGGWRNLERGCPVPRTAASKSSEECSFCIGSRRENFRQLRSM